MEYKEGASLLGTPDCANSAACTKIKQTAEKHGMEVEKAKATILSSKASALMNTTEAAKKAQAIVDWREKYGNFAAVEQLLEIKGIGEAT